MEIFLDTANLDEIREIVRLGVISGVTTNPKIVSAEKGCDFEKQIHEILKLVDGPLSVEVTTNDLQGMVDEAEKYAKWHKNIVIKIPMGMTGLKAVNILKKKGIKTNVTCIMAFNQVVLAAQAGATYASIFYARVGDMGYNAQEVVKQSVDWINSNKIETKIIVGSIRHLMDINEAVLAGTHVITIPTKFFKQMAENPNTTKTVDEFLAAWADFRSDKK